MRWLALVAVLGCGKRINPAWCQQPENQSAAECSQIADALAIVTTCSSNPDCASADPHNPYCNTMVSPAVCVECTDRSQCSTDLPACTQNICSTCVENVDCGSDLCILGKCEAAAKALFASPAGTPSDCTNQAAPCDLTTGIAQAIAQGKVLDLVPSGSNVTFKLTSTVELKSSIRITGEGVIIDGGTADPAIKIEGGTATLLSLTIQNAPGAALQCETGGLSARRIFIQNSKDNGRDAAIISGQTCQVSIDESVVVNNARGALDLVSANELKYLVQNSVFANNSGGPAVTLNGMGSFVYNTVVDNQAKDTTGGIVCQNGPTLDMDIIADNEGAAADPMQLAPAPPPKPDATPPPPQFTGCDVGRSYTGYNVNFEFLGGSNAFTHWHLTQFSPTTVVNIADVKCDDPANPTHDIDDKLRPAHNRCDMGADECDSCYQTANF
jgi:hypothetical protein